MKIRQRALSLALAAVLCMALVTPAFAAGKPFGLPTVSGGMAHTLALDADGTVWAWGSNQQLQLGQPATVTESRERVQVPELPGIISVAAGYDFSAALCYDGTVYTWGGARNAVPVQALGLTGVTAIAAGQTDILALKIDGTVWQWANGQTPRQVRGLSDIHAVSAGASYYLALDNAGKVWKWEGGGGGQLGGGGEDQAPMQLPELFDIVSIAVGYDHSLAADFGGNVYAWGGNHYGQLGDETTEDNAVPTLVPNLKDVVMVSAGNEDSMALTDAGKVYTWGYGEYGQLGARQADLSRTKPVAISVSDGGTVAFISSGVYHNMSVSTSGALYVWGRNKNQQIGSQQNVNALTPKKVMSEVMTGSAVELNTLSGISGWAEAEVEPLYQKNLVPPMLWSDFSANITRGEFAHMLVSVYERAKDVRASEPSTTLDFEDISDHPLKSDMMKAHQLGFLGGTGKTTLSPDRSITRQEAAKMLCSFVGKMQRVTISEKVDSLAFYEDAADIEVWAAPYVSYAYTNNIMKGSGTEFRPQSKITREQSLLVMARLVEKYAWVKK